MVISDFTDQANQNHVVSQLNKESARRAASFYMDIVDEALASGRKTGNFDELPNNAVPMVIKEISNEELDDSKPMVEEVSSFQYKLSGAGGNRMVGRGGGHPRSNKGLPSHRPEVFSEEPISSYSERDPQQINVV